VTAGAVAGSARLRRRRRWPAGLAALVGVAGAGAGLWLFFGSGPGSSGQAARRLLRASLAAAEAAGSFHYVASSTSAVPGGPALTQRTAGDAAQHGGTQTITVSGDTFHVEVLGPVAYFRGDAPAMVQVLGVPPAVAQAYAGRWISLVAGDGPYSSVQVAVTAPSALAQNITFEAETQLPPSTLDGRRVIGLRGPMTAVQGQVAHGSATLYVSASGAHLPVRYVEHGTLGSGSRRSSEEFSITFSAWGEAVPLSAPPGAVPFSSLGVEGAGPSGPTLIT
jgi:hypothetical protein